MSQEIKSSNVDVVGKPVFIRIFKQEDIFELWVANGAKFELYKTYKICAWSGNLGPKLKEGDGQSPEGFYSVAKSQLKPDSSYHRAFNLGFPNEYDKAHGRTGSFLMVHGNCVSIGCYAMTDPIIEEIYYLVEAALSNGQKAFQVHIFPFKMTEENLEKYKSNKWIKYWWNLKEGHDLFEKNKVPPAVGLNNKNYIFREL